MISLTHACLITDSVKRLRDFYEKILNFSPQFDGDSYVEFQTEISVLAIFDLDKHNEMMTADSAAARLNKSIILEFRVDDAQKEFERISKMKVEIIKPVTTQEWGNTSFWFKDPDGNFLNFYSRKELK